MSEPAAKRLVVEAKDGIDPDALRAGNGEAWVESFLKKFNDWASDPDMCKAIMEAYLADPKLRRR